MAMRRRGFTLLQLMIAMLAVSVLAAVMAAAVTRSRREARHCQAGATLKALVTQEGIWRAQDIDGNGTADYWTKDVAAFHCVHDSRGSPVRLVDLALARADKAPGIPYPELQGPPAPKLDYFYQAMARDQDGETYLQPGAPPAKAANAPPGVCTHSCRFGFTAFPAKLRDGARLVFMVSEDGVVWMKETGSAAPVLDRQAGAPPGKDATWGQFGY